MSTKNYIKKTLVKSELSAPDAKAERLKRLRNLTNLTRKEICDFSNINLNTYKGWELGRYGGLPADGAEKIVNQALKSGVICTTDWLLYGKEPPPSLLPPKNAQESESEERPLTPLNLIEKEFSIFQSACQSAVLEKIVDDSVAPNFKKGDYVAGVKKFNQEMDLAIDELSIVETRDGKKLIRYVKKGSLKGHYTLISVNPLSKAEDLVILNTKLVYAAPISRSYLTSNIHL